MANPSMGTESPHPCADRRQARRYRLALPVEIGDSRGQTPDISTSGVFLELDTDRIFSPGELVSFTLQSEHADPDHPVHLQCQGVVVRVEPCDGKVGVIVRFTSFQFETGGQSSPVE
jgi:hypothetical protein